LLNYSLASFFAFAFLGVHIEYIIEENEKGNKKWMK